MRRISEIVSQLKKLEFSRALWNALPEEVVIKHMLITMGWLSVKDRRLHRTKVPDITTEQYLNAIKVVRDE